MNQHTKVVIAADRDTYIVEKLAEVGDALAAMLPLLTKMVAMLEAQQAGPPPPPMATYAQLYEAVEPGPPEGEWVATLPAPLPRVGWWGRLFPARRMD